MRLTKSLVQHGLLGLFLLVIVVNQRRMGKPEREHNLKSNNHWRSQVVRPGSLPAPGRLSPLVVGRGPQQHHDHQQNGGEQETPEGVVHPEVPPTLWKGWEWGKKWER